MKSYLLLLPAVVLLVSGCTIPGTGITIQLPWSNTISLENDIVIIRELEAIPGTVTAPQTIRLVAAIQNQGDKEFPLKDITVPLGGTINTIPVTVELFDHCEGLFDVKLDICDNPIDDKTCELASSQASKLLPKETKEVSWILTPDPNTKLITPCTLKVAVSYPYVTDGLTTIRFINSDEYERQLAQGTYSTSSSTVSLGQGPVKAWYEVKDKQPIPTAPDSAADPVVPVNIMVENRGTGFVKNSHVVLLKNTLFETPFTTPKQTDCGFDVSGDKSSIKLINDERELPCWAKQLKDGDVVKESTHQLITQIEYIYEFRKEFKVTVNPPFNP